MSSSVIIEARQLDAQTVTANGDYEVTLAEPIILQNQDVWSMKNCMLDTVLENSNIIIEDDITVQTSTCPFFNDIMDFSANIEKNQFATGLPSAYTQTLLDYAPMKKFDAGTATGFVSVSGWNYTIYSYATEGPGKTKSYTTTYRYINEFNQVCYTHGVVDWVGDLPNPITKTDTFPTVVGLLESFTAMSNSIPNDWGVTFAYTPNSTPLTSVIYRPYSMQNSFTINKGIYAPSEIAAIVTEKMTVNSGGSTKSMVQSPYLWSSESFEVGYNQPDGSRNPDGSPQKIEEAVIFCDPALNYAITFNTGTKQWIGSSQLALQWDSDSQRFSFVFTHFPAYDSTGENICVKYARSNNDLANPIQGISHYGGVFFNSLTATDSKGQLYDFWDAKLGFLTGGIVSNIELLGPINNTRFSKLGTFYRYSLVPGQPHSVGFFGVDSCVIKSVGTNGNWWEEKSFSVGTDVLYATINNTLPVRAALTLPEILNKFSHYILQCDLFFTQMVGDSSYRNLQGTISKYYSYGSFCYGGQDGAFEYIHQGQPIYIQSIRIRLLRPDKTLDPLLGPDNTCYFQKISNTPNLVKAIN